MSFYDFFNGFFGNNQGGNGRPPEFEDDKFGFNNPKTPNWNPEFDDDDMKQFSSMFDFKMMTDPFEMHRFFEQKVNEMMKTFMSPEGFPSIPGFGVFDSPSVPAIEGSKDPRDHYLKPGAKLPPASEKNDDEKSSNTSTWLDKFTPPRSGQDGNQSFSSFRSVIRKTITLPDGTVKTEEIIRNSDGTEERTESNSPQLDSPFSSPGFPGFFQPPKVPEFKDPRYQFLKPGYEKFNPYSEKIDRDLDKQIEQSGIESLPPLTKEPGIVEPSLSGSLRSFTRRTVTLPNGVVESEEITRDPDGTEQRTVTHIWPDGTTKSVTVPSSEPFAGKSKDFSMEGYDKPVLSFALRGVKDFIDMLFK